MLRGHFEKAFFIGPSPRSLGLSRPYRKPPPGCPWREANGAERMCATYAWDPGEGGHTQGHCVWLAVVSPALNGCEFVDGRTGQSQAERLRPSLLSSGSLFLARFFNTWVGDLPKYLFRMFTNMQLEAGLPNL